MPTEQRRDALGAEPLAQALRLVTDAAVDALVVVDREGVVEQVNPVADRLFGTDAGSLVGRPVEALIGGDDADRDTALVRGFLADPPAGPTSLDLTTRARRADGATVPVEITLTPIDLDGRLRVYARVLDISGRLADQARTAALTRGYRMLASVTEAMVRAGTPDELYRQASQAMVDAGEYRAVGIFTLTSERTLVHAGAAGVLDALPREVATVLDPRSPSGSVAVAAAFAGTTTVGHDLMSDERTVPYRDFLLERDIQAVATLPVRCDDAVVAVLMVLSGRPLDFDAEHVRLLDRVSQDLGVALSSLSARRRLQEALGERDALAARLLDAQEEERARIAADIHDESVQSLASIDLRLGLLDTRLATLAPDLVPQVEHVRRAAAQATAGLRDLLFTLDPGEASVGLAAGLEEAAHHVLNGGQTTWSVTGEPDLPLGRRQRVQVLRVAKEALANAAKHAGADRVEIRLTLAGEVAEMAVIDDGSGFDPGAVPRRPGHRGLNTMADRAEVLGGSLEVSSRPGGGTAVTLRVPLRDAS